MCETIPNFHSQRHKSISHPFNQCIHICLRKYKDNIIYDCNCMMYIYRSATYEILKSNIRQSKFIRRKTKKNVAINHCQHLTVCSIHRLFLKMEFSYNPRTLCTMYQQERFTLSRCIRTSSIRFCMYNL